MFEYIVSLHLNYILSFKQNDQAYIWIQSRLLTHWCVTEQKIGALPRLHHSVSSNEKCQGQSPRPIMKNFAYQSFSAPSYISMLDIWHSHNDRVVNLKMWNQDKNIWTWPTQCKSLSIKTKESSCSRKAKSYDGGPRQQWGVWVNPKSTVSVTWARRDIERMGGTATKYHEGWMKLMEWGGNKLWDKEEIVARRRERWPLPLPSGFTINPQSKLSV